MLTRLRHRAHGQEGFTLIELLVVILIIGILAAVAIPAFLNQRGKAQDANVKSDINTAQTAEETFYTDGEAYTTTSTDLTNIEPTLTDAFKTTGTNPEKMTLGTTAVYGAANSGTGVTVEYSITGDSPSGVQYGLTKWSDGTVSRSCDISSAVGKNPAGCKVSGTATQGTW